MKRVKILDEELLFKVIDHVTGINIPWEKLLIDTLLNQ